jgi:soluble P-type ATPase
MIKIDFPGNNALHLEHLVFDVNGTLAVDGKLIDGVPERLERLKPLLSLHLLTADTHGKQIEIDRALGLTAIRITSGQEAEQKGNYIQQLGSGSTAALGQGANDRLMLQEAGLGICLISPEGTAVETLQAADLVIGGICQALDLFLNPLRITASLRK